MSALISALASDAITQLGAAMTIGGAIVAAAILRGPAVREVPAAPTSTFDQHTAAACALLDPDPALPDDGAALIGRVVADAVDQLASAIAAERAALSPDVAACHRDQAFTRLYRSLTGAELTRALVVALTEQAEDRAAVLVEQFRSLPTAHREESL